MIEVDLEPVVLFTDLDLLDDGLQEARPPIQVQRHGRKALLFRTCFSPTGLGIPLPRAADTEIAVLFCLDKTNSGVTKEVATIERKTKGPMTPVAFAIRVRLAIVAAMSA